MLPGKVQGGAWKWGNWLSGYRNDVALKPCCTFEVETRRERGGGADLIIFLVKLQFCPGLALIGLKATLLHMDVARRWIYVTRTYK